MIILPTQVSLIASFVVLALVLLAQLAPVTSDSDLQSALESAAQLLTRREFDAAERQLKAILDVYPHNHDALQLYGELAVSFGLMLLSICPGRHFCDSPPRQP
jgi:hypothetical protein